MRLAPLQSSCEAIGKGGQKLKLSPESPMLEDSCSMCWLGGKFLKELPGLHKEKPGVQARALTSIRGVEGGETLCDLPLLYVSGSDF